MVMSTCHSCEFLCDEMYMQRFEDSFLLPIEAQHNLIITFQTVCFGKQQIKVIPANLQSKIILNIDDYG
jgi:hypothetical protein